MRSALPLCLAALTVALLSGCSDDAVKPASTPQDAGIIRGQIHDSDFEFEIARAGSDVDPLEGPFVLRGTNLHYDDTLGALVVDLTVINRGSFPHHEPVGLTFIDLIPDAVTVLNPDNDIHGDGAAIVFQFANDDGVWTPGEVSLPHTVQFGVDKGVSIGFVARLDIGQTIDGGTIAGLVWNDADKDGVRDDGEPGVPGVTIYLRKFSGGPDDSTSTSPVWVTYTGPEGRYAFDHLRAGGYVVSDMPAFNDFFPTTPTEIHVLLTEVDGDVSDFLGANFGGVPQIGPPPIGVGQRVFVEGKFFEPDYFNAYSVFHLPCPDDSIIPLGGANDPPDNECSGGRLRGPVTAIGQNGGSFKVMNTWVIPDAAMNPPYPIEVGSRVDVHVHRPGGPAAWVADSIEKWDGAFEELHGRVDAVDFERPGIFRILVLDTWIVLPNPVPGGGDGN